jgi:hypothetical protein
LRIGFLEWSLNSVLKTSAPLGSNPQPLLLGKQITFYNTLKLLLLSVDLGYPQGAPLRVNCVEMPILHAGCNVTKLSLILVLPALVVEDGGSLALKSGGQNQDRDRTYHRTYRQVMPKFASAWMWRRSY